MKAKALYDFKKRYPHVTPVTVPGPLFSAVYFEVLQDAAKTNPHPLDLYAAIRPRITDGYSLDISSRASTSQIQVKLQYNGQTVGEFTVKPPVKPRFRLGANASPATVRKVFASAAYSSKEPADFINLRGNLGDWAWRMTQDLPTAKEAESSLLAAFCDRPQLTAKRVTNDE